METDTIETIEPVFYTSVKIHGLPRAHDQLITLLANTRGVNKHEVVRDALIEYAENHKAEIAREVNASE